MTIHSWMRTAEHLGIDLTTATRLGTFAELDALACNVGATGGTFADDTYGRMAYLEHDGTVYVAPARFRPLDGTWPDPGRPETTSSRDRRSDERAGWHYPQA